MKAIIFLLLLFCFLHHPTSDAVEVLEGASNTEGRCPAGFQSDSEGRCHFKSGDDEEVNLDPYALEEYVLKHEVCISANKPENGVLLHHAILNVCNHAPHICSMRTICRTCTHTPSPSCELCLGLIFSRLCYSFLAVSHKFSLLRIFKVVMVSFCTESDGKCRLLAPELFKVILWRGRQTDLLT
jgi:hypothetical protein